MIRELKFRAWDEEGGMMHPPFTINEICEIRKEGGGIGAILMNFNWDQLMWLQFTGLKDKNGTEIYEGDVVRYHVSAPWDDEVPLEVRAEVVFDDPFYGCFCVKSMDGFMDATGCLYEYMDGVEVIGNIYENSDLLNP